MADIESLELQITSDASSAKAGLDALITTLDTLKTKTKGGVGLTSVANQVSKLATATGNLNGSEVAKLEALAKGLNALSGLGNLKLSSNIANQVSAMGNAVKALDGVDYSRLNGLATAVQPLTTLGKSNLGSVLNQIKKLPEVMSELGKVDMGSFTAKIKELTASLKPLADEMQKVANGFSAFPAKIQQYISSSSKVPSTNESSSRSFANLATKITATIYTFKRIASVIASWIDKASQYRENVNLFTVSMGSYAKSAMDYAKDVEEAMGIKPSDWIRDQGIFMTLATGFGIVGDRANEMSQNLTQLGYDLSSYYNISVEEAMQKVKSGFSGELEPLRNLGYDLSQAKLEAIALSLGIDKTVGSMTQAEKAELRYYAVMTQVTQVQGDMARTLHEPANQLRILRAQIYMAAEALGNLFIPILNDVLPYLIAFAKVIRIVANMIASLFGVSIPEIGDALGDAGDGSGALSENLEDASGSAKKLKNALLGIDELNVMPDSSSGGSGSDTSGSGFDYKLPEYKDFLGEAATNRVNEIVESMKKWLGITKEIDTWSEFFDTRLGNILETVVEIGAGIAAWKVATGTLKFIKELEKIKGKNFSWSFGLVGVTTFLADLDKLKKYVEDFVENGPTFSNVTGILSEFAGLVGDAMITLGQVKIGGALKIVQGVGEIVSAIADMTENGVDVENALDVVRGISNIGIAVGVMTGNWTLTGGAMALQGITAIVQELAANWEAIQAGDWSGVDKATLVISAIEVIGGIITALGVLEKIKKKADLAKASETITETTTAVTTVSTTTSTLTTKLGDLVKNLGLGIAIIAEVAAAAAIIVGAIWLLGLELEQVGIAWEPVIANATTVATALGIGTAILVAVGIATALLGTLGGTVCGQIGIGIAILAELGVAAVLFIAEIWAIGKGLDEIGKAWQPVLNNGDTIAKGIGIGTGLLVGIGVVTAALGAATVASAGLLPLAIGLGTAMLVELGDAFEVFIDEIVAVAKQLSDELAPALSDTSEDLPGLSENMEQYTQFMSDFASKVVDYTKASAIVGIAATIDKIIDFFTTDPIDRLSGEIADQHSKLEDLVTNLTNILPVLEDANELMSQFNDDMDTLKASMGVNGKASGTIGYVISVGVSLVKNGWKSISDWIGNLSTTLGIKLPHVGINWVDTGFAGIKYPKFSVSYYAQGGFPVDGQMFVAREAGPELVGSIGNRSAVVNNDQIVESVSRGVYEAVAAAMGGYTGGQSDQAINIYLDGKQITATVEKHQKSRGATLMTGGMAYGY